jgi:hypothetical protein
MRQVSISLSASLIAEHPVRYNGPDASFEEKVWTGWATNETGLSMEETLEKRGPKVIISDDHWRDIEEQAERQNFDLSSARLHKVEFEQPLVPADYTRGITLTYLYAVLPH